MRNNTGAILTFAALLLVSTAYLQANEVVDLRCEYLKNPLGIDVVKPGLSWRIEAQGGKGTTARTERGLKQTAYQILVASSEELLRMEKGDLWDSGKMESDQSIQVEYNGKPLGSGIQCYWKVRIWTNSTLDTESETPDPSSWSRPAMWTMGLLNPSDWQGEWIRLREADTIKHIWYRKNFSLKSVPASAFAYLCSIGYHELYVNGERIGTSVLSPGVTNLEKRALYVTYDISSKLKKGDNVIAVWTGPGWARADGSYGKGVWKQNSIFKCQVNMSNGMSLHSDTSWKCKISSSENLGLWKGGGEGEYGGELIDARRHIANWYMPSFDDGDWANATVYQKSLILSAEMQEPDRKVETLFPVAITVENGQYRIDMGRNFTGWFEIDLHNGKAGDTVKIMTANRQEETLEFNQESQYIFDSSGTGTFCHRFNYMAGRWVTIAGLSYKPEPKDIRGYIVTNDRKRIGSFECSNPLFNEIYETDLRTYIACTMNGVTMDCPHRERFGYGEVALACSWGCAIPNFESAPYYRKAARDWFDVQREDGFVNTIAPQVYKGAGGTLWSSAPVTLSWEYYKAYGDKRQLEEAYLPMKMWLDFLHKSVSAEGVLTAYEKASRFLGDWATPHGSEYGDTPEAKLFNNCVYAYCLDVLVQAAGILGKPDDVTTYSARLADLRKSVHKQFFNEDTKTYIDGRQLAMAFPLYTGITPEHERQAVFANFVEEISKRKPYLDTGSSGLPILLKYIVEDAERADLLYQCLTSTEQPGYGYFLQSGETTWPEYWKITGEASRIHTCYTGIAGYFTRALGGIRPDPTSYGMQKFLIKPSIVGNLTWVNTHHDSFYGRIISNWKLDGDKLTMEVTIPPNTTATVYVPTYDAESVTESGTNAVNAKGVKFLGSENNAAVYAVGPGTYRFQSTNERRFALALDATSGANQPYPALNGGAFDGPAVSKSPDPLIRYRWKETNADDDLQIYTLRPIAAVADVKDAFVNLESATGVTTSITVKGTGSIRLDFGVESAAWLEFDSPDLAGDVQMSISEYNQPAVVNNGPEHPVKTAVPVKHGNTYRLELNSELYEGVRFGWIHVRSFTSQWHITGVRLICQTKPTNYNGSFSCSDTMLTKIWFTGAYGVKLNLTKDYFGAILMDRGDRISWTGDAHPSQAAALVAFGNYDFIKKNIANTSGQDNGIRSYSLYWVLSLVDYFRYTGDTTTLQTYIDNACRKLDDAYLIYGTNPRLGFYGWDERLGAGFEQHSCMESQNAYKMLTIRAWKEFASAMGALGRTDLRDKYNGYANAKIALLRQNSAWYQSFGLHANADAVTTGLLNADEKKAVFEQNFTDRVNRVSFSPFNQYFVIQAFALMNKYDDALSSIRDLWGGMIEYGGTTLFEDFRPSWNKVLEKNDPVPNNQAGYTSLCHPWGGGVTKWLSEEILGIRPTSPGFSTFDVIPHLGRTLTSVTGTTPTPHGPISGSFNVSTGACEVSVPAGTVGRIGIPKVEKTINAIRVNGALAWDGTFHSVAGIGEATSDSQFVYLTGVQPGSYSITVSYSGVTPAYSEPQESWPARFIGEDSTTSGNWGKVYGKDGFVLCNYNGNRSDKTMLPTYISSFIFHEANVMNNASPLVWSAGTTDTRAPAPDSSNTIPRNAACMFTDWATMSFTCTVAESREYSIALYFLDWDDKGRRIAVEMMDAETLNQIAPVKIIDNFKGGRYLIYSYNKSAKFRIHQVRGDNAVLSGIFFDPGNGSSIQPDSKTDK